MLDVYSLRLQHYRLQVFDIAEKNFLNALPMRPGDGPSRAMLKRCRMLEQKPPSSGWDAVFNQVKKFDPEETAGTFNNRRINNIQGPPSLHSHR